jgi:Zn-dependent M28 family amino/carboxypeptidase
MSLSVRLRPLVLILLAAAGARAAGAQDGAPRAAPVPPARAVELLMREALERGRSYALLQELCKDMPHRLAGSPGAEEAERWAARTMTSLGFANVRLEPCQVPRWERGTVARLEVAAPESARRTPLPILALGGSIATPKGGVRGELVAVTSFEELSALGERVRGKIVLFNRPMDPGEADPFAAYGKAVGQRGQGAIEAGRLGAVAALVRSMTLRLDDVPHTGAMRYDEAVPRIPAAAVSTAGAERLAHLLRAGPVTLVLEMDPREHPDVTGHNVVGELVGRERPDEIVVVGGHLDAWDVGEGAHDDGAGCVQAIEALRLVQACGLVPRRTLRCVLWANEENGLRGARAYRDAHAKELEKHVLSLESDRGGFAPRGFETNATGKAWDELVRVAALLEPWGAGMLRRGGGGADTSPLEALGLNVMEFLPDATRYFDFHHCARDTVDQVHPRELALSTGAIAAMVFSVADLAEPLPRAAPPPSEGTPRSGNK